MIRTYRRTLDLERLIRTTEIRDLVVAVQPTIEAVILVPEDATDHQVATLDAEMRRDGYALKAIV